MHRLQVLISEDKSKGNISIAKDHKFMYVIANDQMIMESIAKDHKIMQGITSDHMIMESIAKDQGI